MRNIGQVVNQSPSAFLEFMYKLYATEKSSLVYHVSDFWALETLMSVSQAHSMCLVAYFVEHGLILWRVVDLFKL